MKTNNFFMLSRDVSTKDTHTNTISSSHSSNEQTSPGTAVLYKHHS